MAKRLANLAEVRREEIIDACEKLYQTMSFKDITMIEIGKVTPFQRTSIYNYFSTKEEIFLALLKREYNFWIEDIEKNILTKQNLTKIQLADELAKTLQNRLQLLKLLSMNHFDVETNCRDENLIDFKKSYGKTMQVIKNCLDRLNKKISDDDKEKFLYAFLPFVYGIYPYAVVTDKQKQAMQLAMVDFKFQSIYELAYNFLIKLLK